MKLDRNEIARFVATLGIAMLIASFIRYYIQGELLTFSKGLLIAGAVCVVAALVIGFRGVVDYFSKRSTKQGSNTLVLTLAVLAILIIANVIGYRHPKRIDLTTEKLYTLSDQTRNVVAGLKQDVTIIRFDKTPSESFDDLMNEYKHLSPHIQARTVDPNQKPDVAAEYGATQMGDVMVAVRDPQAACRCRLRIRHLRAGHNAGDHQSDQRQGQNRLLHHRARRALHLRQRPAGLQPGGRRPQKRRITPRNQST